jgi:uncharacterized protein (TIGR02996 family)
VTLEHAREQLVAGDAAFYETARAAWRACRCEALATMLDTLAHTHGRPAIDEAKPKAWHAAWVARVREDSPLDLPGLLAGLVERARARQASMIASCLDELARHPDDPQLVLPLIALLEIEAASSAWNKVHTRIFQLLEGAGDPRAIALLEPAVARATTTPATYSDSMKDSLARAARTRDKLRERFPDGVPARPANLAKPIAALVAARPAKPLVATTKVDELDTLYAAVLEDPDDDARRSVYADALSQRGDPRGEVIALQLSGAPPAAKKKAAALIAKHKKLLLGAIAKNIIADTMVFEKGFLAACDTDVRRATEAEVIFGRDEWATVKRLRFRAHGVLTPVMRSLEEAYGVPENGLAMLRAHTLPRLRVLELHPPASRGGSSSLANGKPKGMLAILTETKGLPALRDLRVQEMGGYEWTNAGRRARTATDFAWLLDAPCAAHLEHLTVPSDRDDVSALQSWVTLLHARSKLQTIRVLLDGAWLVLEREGKEVVAFHEVVHAHVAIAPQNLGLGEIRSRRVTAP